MDGSRFDQLTKTLNDRVGRRTVFGLIAAAGIVAATPELTDAKACKPKCSICKRCSKGKCKSKPGGSSCPGGRCTGGRCVSFCSDGVKNGSETDVDCGGPTCRRCAAGRSCLTNTDCNTSRCGDGLGSGNVCGSCSEDGVCGSDANGGCLCDATSGACHTDKPATFVSSCAVCPLNTICIQSFDGDACVPLCGG